MTWRSQGIMVRLPPHPPDLHETLHSQDNLLVRELSENACRRFESNCDYCKDRNLPCPGMTSWQPCYFCVRSQLQCTSTPRRQRAESLEAFGLPSSAPIGVSSTSGSSMIGASFNGDLPDAHHHPSASSETGIWKLWDNTPLLQSAIDNTQRYPLPFNPTSWGQNAQIHDAKQGETGASVSSVSNAAGEDRRWGPETTCAMIPQTRGQPVGGMADGHAATLENFDIHCPRPSSTLVANALSELASFLELEPVPSNGLYDVAEHHGTFDGGDLHSMELYDASIANLVSSFQDDMQLDPHNRNHTTFEGLHYSYQDIFADLGIPSTNEGQHLRDADLQMSSCWGGSSTQQPTLAHQALSTQPSVQNHGGYQTSMVPLPQAIHAQGLNSLDTPVGATDGAITSTSSNLYGTSGFDETTLNGPIDSGQSPLSPGEFDQMSEAWFPPVVRV